MPPIRLAVSQPCTQSWAAMTPTAAGRHCAACATEVVDFTRMSDAEILAYLATAAHGRTCGRFAAGQLGRPLQRAAAAAPTARWRAWLAAALALWGVRESRGYEARAQAPTEWYPRYWGGPVPEAPPVPGPGAHPARAGVLLRGVVFDASSQEGLPGAAILVGHTTMGTASAADGTFELAVPAEYVRAGVVALQVKAVGFVTAERDIAASADTVQLVFRLQPDVKGLLGEVVVAGMPDGVHFQQPWPWHPRRFYRWARHWLTRPFRRASA